MAFHPFKPLILKNTTKLLVGTLPPENAPFYFSNSSNTRLWDILKSIDEKSDIVKSGGNFLPIKAKSEILNRLGLGICDIIYQYLRDDYTSTKDIHIEPIQYNNFFKLTSNNPIAEFLFVYESAYKWFLHSLEQTTPVRLKCLRSTYGIGLQSEVQINQRFIKCILLPSPLNRGRKGETLAYKLGIYKKFITGD